MRLFLACLAAIASAGARDLGPWVVEQMPGGRVTWQHDILEIEDSNGCTVWLRQELTAPVVVEYDAVVVSQSGPFDRVSDLNCFWMAQERRSDALVASAAPFAPPQARSGKRRSDALVASAAPFTPPQGRSGKFSDYDSLATYYVGYGGNTNTTTRFRRYDGHGARPLRPEDDRRDPALLLIPNHTYHIRLEAKNGVAEYYRDGEKLFSFRDPSPLTHGRFAIRTVKSHLIISHVRFTTGSVSFHP